MRLRRLSRSWPIGIAVILAVGAAAYQGLFEAQTGSTNVAVDAIASLLSNGRLQTFVLLPAWFIASALGIHATRESISLVRFGTWKRTIAPPLLRCLRLYGLASVATLLGWVVLLSFFGGWGGLPGLVAVAAGELVLLAAVLTTLHLAMSAIQQVVGTVVGLIVVPTALWLWVALANTGVTYGTGADLGRYLSIAAVAEAPGLAAAILGAMVAAGAAAWLVADRRDTAESNGVRLPPVGSLLEAGFFVLMIIAAITSRATERTLASGITAVFFGAGGTVLQYLLGISLVLAASLGALLRFTEEWEQRAQIVAIRFGSTGRWLRSRMSGFIGRTAAYLASAVVVVAVIRSFLFGEVPVSAVDLVAVVHVFVLLLATATLFILIGLSSVLAVGSATAGLCAIGAMFALGVLPVGGSPWNPITAWSMSWWQVADTEVAASSGLAVVVGVVLFVFVAVRRRTV